VQVTDQCQSGTANPGAPAPMAPGSCFVGGGGLTSGRRGEVHHLRHPAQKSKRSTRGVGTEHWWAKGLRPVSSQNRRAPWRPLDTPNAHGPSRGRTM